MNLMLVNVNVRGPPLGLGLEFLEINYNFVGKWVKQINGHKGRWKYNLSCREKK